MDDLSDQSPVTPRVDEAAADLGTMVELGLAEEPPVPSPFLAPFLEPQWPPPASDDAA
ncbi:hypothetical protein [Streptomyces niveus]|uniref:hypothetical protein n=1 Tax=Streptomyces niveus TaxID=193462 RepID=UPI0036D317C0